MTQFKLLGEPQSETETYADVDKRVQKVGGFDVEDDATMTTPLSIEARRYFALYEATCTLALLVERIEMGFPQTANSHLIVDAKRELRQVASVTHSDFFTKFERAFRIDRE